MTTKNTSTILSQLRTVLDLTNTEIQVAETRVAPGPYRGRPARTDPERGERSRARRGHRKRDPRARRLSRRHRAVPGSCRRRGEGTHRAGAAVRRGAARRPRPRAPAVSTARATSRRSRSPARHSDVEALADRLITAHSATVDWLTTVLAEDALGGPAALRRTPLQAAAGTAVQLVNVPAHWSARHRPAVDTVRATRPAVGRTDQPRHARR